MATMTARIERVEGTVMAVNSYLIHGPDGIVVVDGQLTIGDAVAVREAVERSGQPLAALVITHPHPDHYAGAGLIAPPDVPILATRAVAEIIRRDDSLKDSIVGPMMGDQWPDERRFPGRIVESGDVVNLAGLRLTVRDAGPGESHADSIWTLDDAWFTADLLCPRMDAYLADGHYRAWLASLERLRAEATGDVTFYPGHGSPASRDDIAGQQDYINAFLDAVTGTLGLDAAGRRARVLSRMAPLAPDPRLRFLMELSIEPVAATLQADSAVAGRPLGD